MKTEKREDGVYFDLPFDEYLKLPRLSSHGISTLSRSTDAYWSGSWFNVGKYESESASFKIGKAYHVRMLEGKEEFLKQYATEQDVGVFAGAYDKVQDIRKAITEHDARPVGTKKGLLIGQLLGLEPEAKFVEIIKHDYAKLHEGKIFVNNNIWNDIMRSCEDFESSEHGDVFKFGRPEVTVLWTDKATGLPMKARFDYLKPELVPDLKTFADQGKPIKKAITTQIAMYKYYIQMAVYREAREQARTLPQFGGNMNLDCDFKQCMVFQETGQTNITRIVNFDKDLMLAQKGNDMMHESIDKFVKSYNKYKNERWIDDEAVIDLTDEDFPMWVYDED